MTKPTPKPQPSEESMKIADGLAVASRRQNLSCVELQTMIARALDERGKAEYKLGYEAGRKDKGFEIALNAPYSKRKK